MPVPVAPGFLMVPIKLDVLLVPAQGYSVLEPFADFSRLPYYKKDAAGNVGPVNDEQPYTSETALSRPFFNQNDTLEPGAHLHWALPDVLTHARQKGDTLEFPAVPNRWLVLRFREDLVEKKWMVQSDFLWPEGTPADVMGQHPKLKTTLHHRTPEKPGDHPFRYQGRVDDFSNQASWRPPLVPGSDVVKKLTAVGYGEPTFAAFYPNCRHIFGLYDPEITKESILSDISYEVYGWYDNGNDDFIRQFTTEFNLREAGLTADQVVADPLKDSPELKWLQTLQEENKWSLPATALPDKKAPARMMCYAKLSFVAPTAALRAEAVVETKLAEDPENPFNMNGIELAVGNTGTEALSAYLAGKMQPDNADARLRIERQLESLQLRDWLKDQKGDLGMVFEEARHTKSFRPVSAGRVWTLRPETAKAAGQEHLQDIHRIELAGKLFLPPGLDDKLDAANALEGLYDQSMEGIQSLQQQIFADWHKYMQCVYHDNDLNYLPGTLTPTFPDIDDARRHSEKMLDLLRLNKAFLGDLKFDETNAKQGKSAWSDVFVPGTLPDVPDLMNLVPSIRPEFIDWLEQWRNSKPVPPPSIAARLAALLNEIDAALTIYDALVNRIRPDYERLKDPKKTFTLAELVLLAKTIDSRNDHLPETILKPASVAVAKVNAIATNTALTEAAKIDAAKTALLGILEPWATLPVLFLEPAPAPRYWQSNEPVLLMAGPVVEPTDRHGMDNADGDLICNFLPLSPPDRIGSAVILSVFISNAVNVLHAFGSSHAPGLNETDGNPWHPIFFEWEVRIDPLAMNGNLDKGRLEYTPDFISGQFKLDETRSEFTLAKDPATTQSASYVSGRSILTPHAHEKLVMELEDFLILKAKAFRVLKNTPAPEGDDPLPLKETDKDYRKKWMDYFKTNREKIVKHTDDFFKVIINILNGIAAGQKTFTLSDFSPLHTILDAWDRLQDLNFLQTQALSGFNKALLMLHQTLQMEIAEPAGFTEYQAFSKKVADAVGFKKLLAVTPDADFHPLRSGAMQVFRLRLVDNFGRSYWLADASNPKRPLNRIFAPEEMRTDTPGTVILPPRIVQPARVNFRWLSAQNNSNQVNAHPDASPICGWIVPNNFDASILIYAAAGELLGYVDENGRWRPAPGKIRPAVPEDIENPALRKMVRWIVRQAREQPEGLGPFVETFLNDLEGIMEHIAPDSYKQHQARSLLLGQPIALVQAVVNLDLRGWPATHQGMYWYKTVVKGGVYQTDGFTGVNIPIRIGERNRFNDGTVGYWLDQDNEDTYLDGDAFHAPFSSGDGPHAAVESNKLTIQQSIGAPAQRLSILLDPRGLVHCTTGVLPTKAIGIPGEHYTAALQRLQSTFLTAPLLSEPGHLNLALPDEVGFNWSWVQRDGAAWSELSQGATIRYTALLAAFEDGAKIWDLLRSAGWIDPEADLPGQARLRLPAERKQANLFTPDDPVRQSDIERVLQIIAVGIVPAITDARIGQTSEIREGWLVLKPGGVLAPDGV